MRRGRGERQRLGIFFFCFGDIFVVAGDITAIVFLLTVAHLWLLPSVVIVIFFSDVIARVPIPAAIVCFFLYRRLTI